MLIDIPPNLELVIADEQGVRTLRNGAHLDDDKLRAGQIKIMGMRMVAPPAQPTISSNQTKAQNYNLQFGAIIFNIGFSMLVYEHFGALGLIGYGVLWMCATVITANVHSELDSSKPSRGSSSATRAPSAGDSTTPSTP